ncbi:MAG TPA: M48 family metallopeptidase, partial [Dehalococcoidales bacterium]|nr:M48 family metallopeptidase [Dehalococcoidales bacterium]
SLIAKFGIELVADLFNIKDLQLRLPSALEGLYKPDEYRKSQKYIQVSTSFGIIESAFSLAIILVFWFSRGFNFLDSLVRSWGFIPLVNGLLYLGILFVSYGLITLPFSIYNTFVLEQRFGFNRATVQTFIIDKLKMLVLGVILGGALLSAVLAIFQYGGVFAWLYCWVAVIIFSIGTQFIAPTWIMPLFNKFTPLEKGELQTAILNYAESVNFPVKNISVMDGSKRSSKSNAFFTGFGSNKRIALFDTLIQKHSTGELVAILAHEIGHYKKKHVFQGIIINVLSTGLILFLFSIFLNQTALYQAFYVKQPSIYAGIIFFSLLYTLVGLLFSILIAWISRKNEKAADIFAASTSDPDMMVESLKKLSTTNLSNLSPHPFYVFLNYSHPPLLQRLQAIEEVKLKKKTRVNNLPK